MNPSWEGQKRQHHITSKSLPQEHRNYFNLKTSPSAFQSSEQLPLAGTMQERLGLKYFSYVEGWNKASGGRDGGRSCSTYRVRDFISSTPLMGGS